MTQKNQMTVLAVVGLVMGVVWYFNRTTSATNPGNVATFQNYQLLAVENPQLHRDKMEEAQKTEYHSLGRNPFSEIAPPKDQPKETKVAQHVLQAPPILPPAPPPPTLPGNMKYFGYGTIPNGTLR